LASVPSKYRTDGVVVITLKKCFGGLVKFQGLYTDSIGGNDMSWQKRQTPCPASAPLKIKEAGAEPRTEQ
jgi:hypothetical protein